MAGRINDDDIATVRDRARIDEVVREYVTLRGAGAGSLKGLCPFHDERSPSFHVTPARGMWYCFGCSRGGDVISFLQEVDHLSFAESIERLADKVGIALRYEEASGVPSANPRGSREQRTRLVEAHRAAAEFYAVQLGSAEAVAGRRFLDERGFDRTAAAHFGVGYAPRGGDELRQHLSGKGFTELESVTAGLLGRSDRGRVYDKFRGRLVWPIRDLLGDVVGFGARRLYDDDRVEAKYLNTSDTPIYKKSHVLYGVDLAKREIAKQSQVVVVEGYTDVMACHLAGVTTAVASCGTAFGEEHVRIVRRLLNDQDSFRGKVVYTFDGDSAGQKAALRAFEGDQKFVGQTYVAVEPNGLDPCEVRQRRGDDAVRSLVEHPQPLFEFAIRSFLRDTDLDTAEGRVRGLDRAVPLVARIRDTSLRDEYARRLAGWVGSSDEAEVVRRVRGAVRTASQQPIVAPQPDRARTDAGASGQQQTGSLPPSAPAVSVSTTPRSHGDVDPQTLSLEREVLKCAIQWPRDAGASFDELPDEAFSSPVHQLLRQAVAKAGGAAEATPGAGWVESVADGCPDDDYRTLVAQLAVESIASSQDGLGRYVRSMVLQLHGALVGRQIETARSRMQRAEPDDDGYTALFADLMTLEARRRELKDRALLGD